MALMTVKQIADSTPNLSKQGIFHRIKRIPHFKKHYVVARGSRGAMLINHKGVERILHLGNSNHYKHNISWTVYEDTLAENRHKSAEIEHLTHALEQSQAITRSAQKQLRELKLNPPKPPKQHGFWYRLFH